MKLLLYEFKDLCQRMGYHKFILSSEDNYNVFDNISLSINSTFNSVDVFANPDVIALRNDTDIITFRRVKKIFLIKQSQDIGDLFMISCSPATGSAKYIDFKILAV